MRQIILFGGTFDPVHDGHLEIAKNALKEIEADAVWFLLAAQSPFKEENTSFKQRETMLKMMLEGEKNLFICDIENNLPKPSYSIDTLKALKKIHPDAKFSWLIGSDQIKDLNKWKDFKTLNKLVQFIVYEREGYEEAHPYPVVKGSKINVSSTEIREGKSYLTKPEILNYMMHENLYLNTLCKNSMSSYRFEHTLRVTDLAVSLGSVHHLDLKKIRLIGMCHDLCKEYDMDEMTKMMKKHYPEHLNLPKAFYHGFMASFILKTKYHIQDKDVLDAIENHVGGTSYNPYAMILFIADKCEPGRVYDASHLIELTKQDLEKGFMAVKKENEAYLKEHL